MEHPIADEVLAIADFEISRGRNWMAYNRSLYFIDKTDVNFFSNHSDALEFANNNKSDYDSFHIIQIHSISDLLQKIPYGVLLEKSLGIDPDANGLFNKDGNGFTDALIDHIEVQQLSIFSKQLNTNFMNKENLQYLSDNIKYMGFGEELKSDLEKNMAQGKADFQLHYKTEISKKPFEAVLNFRKSDSTDMYFFNNYNASLQRNNGEKVEQTFYLNKGKGVTAKEAFNLLDGRSVQKDLVTKEGQPYKAWLQLDFETKDKNNNAEVKQYHENYGYDLKAAVEKFAVAELKDPDKEKQLMQSLQKGNVQSVTIEKDGNSHKMFLEADPKYKTVKLYDSNMKLVTKESISQYEAKSKDMAQAVKEELKNSKKKEMNPTMKQTKSNEKSLLPKKREGKSKGLGVS
jgi:hypothetical protein